jgi:biopolymer transport protein ExbD
MRTTWTFTCLLALAHITISQSAPADTNADVLTIHICADGVCSFLDTSTPCDRLGQYLVSNHLAQSGHVHISVDRNSKYELVAETLKSLQSAGFIKVGSVNYDPSE